MPQDLKIGKLIAEGDDAARDAIHVAVIPVTSPHIQYPSNRVKLVKGAVDKVRMCDDDDPDYVGVVDPFLTGNVPVGTRFWLFLQPNTITALRHAWTHPKFDNLPPKVIGSMSENWLRKFAEEEADIEYEELMQGAKNYLENDEYMSDGGKWEGFGVPEVFWLHYENVTGDKLPEDKSGHFFSCSC